MAKIDRLGWAAGISFLSYGVRIGIRLNRPEALEAIQACLPPGWKPAVKPAVERLYSFIIAGEPTRPGHKLFNLLYGDAGRLARSTSFDEVLQRFDDDLKLYVAEATRLRIFVHAGVVGWRGKAILIPGRSFSGKTSLVAELVRAGATYYSDEYAVLDARGCVHPYSRPLGVRETTNGKQKNVQVEALGGVSGVKPLPVGLIVVSRFREGARWRPRRLSVGQGALALLANTIPARKRPDAAFAALKQVVAQAQILKGVRGEARDVVDSILQCRSS